MSQQNNIKFSEFVNKFPAIDLPITITMDSSRHFSQQNDPFPPLMIQQFILPYDIGEVDEYTEYVPCLRIKGTKGMQALLYWKAGLMTYDFILITFTDKGAFIDNKVIAGTKVEGNSLVMAVATIDEDWVIHVVGGVSEATSTNYSPSNSQSFELELLPSGHIEKSESESELIPE